jgi:hypothetical protein
MSAHTNTFSARAERYREFAFEADRRATATLFADVRSLFRNVAREWRTLAQEADRATR